jgi:hypothetical protein
MTAPGGWQIWPEYHLADSNWQNAEVNSPMLFALRHPNGGAYVMCLRRVKSSAELSLAKSSVLIN